MLEVSGYNGELSTSAMKIRTQDLSLTRKSNEPTTLGVVFPLSHNP